MTGPLKRRASDNGYQFRPRWAPDVSLGDVITIAVLVIGAVLYVDNIGDALAVVQNEIKHLWAAVGDLKTLARDR